MNYVLLSATLSNNAAFSLCLRRRLDCLVPSDCMMYVRVWMTAFCIKIREVPECARAAALLIKTPFLQLLCHFYVSKEFNDVQFIGLKHKHL